MRKGQNPQKSQKKIRLEVNHRVIMVVFIPELNGYYENTLEVFKLSLDSLIQNSHGNYKITVVNNGSCSELEELLSSYSSKAIDCIIKHGDNIGKIDALIGAARGSREEYITLTDADILFLRNWDKEVMNVFYAFKNAGSVSPIPFRHGLFYGTSSVFREILFKRLKFSYQEIPENFEDHNRYLSSINWNNELDIEIKWPVVERNGIKAIVGSGHQVLSLKREILLSKVPKIPSLTLVGGDSELRYVDEPIDKAGLMRLSTYRNFAFHMGNVVEPWMKEKLEESKSCAEVKSISTREFKKSGFSSRLSHKLYIIRKHLFKGVFRLFYT